MKPFLFVDDCFFSLVEALQTYIWCLANRSVEKIYLHIPTSITLPHTIWHSKMTCRNEKIWKPSGTWNSTPSKCILVTFPVNVRNIVYMSIILQQRGTPLVASSSETYSQPRKHEDDKLYQLVCMVFQYASAAWDSASDTVANLLENVQQRE